MLWQTYIFLLGKSRKKRSRPYPKSVIMWGQSEGEKWTLSRGRHRQKRSASLNTSTEEIVARWLPEAPLCQGLLIFCLSWLNAILWKITGIQSIVFNLDILQTIDLFKFWACFLFPFLLNCLIETPFLQLMLSDQHPPVFSHCHGILNITMGKNGPVPFNYSLPFATDNSGVPPIMSYHPADIFRQPYLLQNQVRVINRAPALGILTFSTFDIKIRDLLVLWMFVEA